MTSVAQLFTSMSYQSGHPIQRQVRSGYLKDSAFGPPLPETTGFISRLLPTRSQTLRAWANQQAEAVLALRTLDLLRDHRMLDTNR